MNVVHIKIKDDIKSAMKEHDTIKRDCLKNVLGKAQDMQKAKYPNMSSDMIDDDIILDAVKKEVKQLNQTVDALKDRKDTELYKVSAQQIDILTEYLPKQMSKDEIENAVALILSNNECNNFGEKMKVVMRELKDKADSKLIKEAVENYN